MERRAFNKLMFLTLLFPEYVFSQEEKKYFLTIDDGYHFQKEILNYANQHNIKLNLFIIGSLINENPKIWIDAIQQGHLLGSHSYYHFQFSKHSYEDIKNDFEKYKINVENKIGKYNFENIKYFRFPYGDQGNKLIRNDIKKLIEEKYGWKIIGWDLDLSFKHHRNITLEEQIGDFIYYKKNHLKQNNIILFHFKKPDNLGIKSLIDLSMKNNIKFYRLDVKN